MDSYGGFFFWQIFWVVNSPKKALQRLKKGLPPIKKLSFPLLFVRGGGSAGPLLEAVQRVVPGQLQTPAVARVVRGDNQVSRHPDIPLWVDIEVGAALQAGSHGQHSSEHQADRAGHLQAVTGEEWRGKIIISHSSRLWLLSWTFITFNNDLSSLQSLSQFLLELQSK